MNNAEGQSFSKNNIKRSQEIGYVFSGYWSKGVYRLAPEGGWWKREVVKVRGEFIPALCIVKYQAPRNVWRINTKQVQSADSRQMLSFLQEL